MFSHIIYLSIYPIFQGSLAEFSELHLNRPEISKYLHTWLEVRGSTNLGGDVISKKFQSYTVPVKCTVYTVKCTVYTVKCAVYTVKCTVYTFKFTVQNVKCTVYTVKCTVYTVKCAVQYTVKCAVLTVKCTTIYFYI